MEGEDPESFRASLLSEMERLREARPTAVNLAWAVDRMRGVLDSVRDRPPAEQREALLAEARRIDEEDQESCRQLGVFGAELIPDGSTVLTHCNAGALATAGQGTALSVVYAAHEAGKKVEVLSDETRPLLQGGPSDGLGVPEDGGPVTLLCDNAAGWVLSQGKVDRIVVGADRIAANGDVANKIGTYPLAVMAREHRGPVLRRGARPPPWISRSSSGKEIPIEQRALGGGHGAAGDAGGALRAWRR